MIIITNESVDINKVIDSYPDGIVEKDIITKMRDSKARRTYSTLDELLFEVNLRTEIVMASVDLHDSRLDFAVFRDARCNEVYWDRTREGGFRLKRGVSPSEAILDIYNNGEKYATECATAMVIVHYKALVSLYKQELFDKVFTEINLMNWHHLDGLLREIGYMVRVGDYIPGDRRYIINPDVDPETPQWQGENLIDLNGELYYGHGVGIFRQDVIINALNRYRIKGSNTSAYMMEKVARPDYERLYKVYKSI